MKFDILDASTDELLGQIDATSYSAAEQEASCYVAENGIDWEYEYTGHYIVLTLEDKR